MKETIGTTLHYYKFSIDNASEKAQYNAMVRVIRKNINGRFRSYSQITPKNGYSTSDWLKNIKKFDGKIVTLELKYLFENQWNTKEGIRMFDWFEAAYPNKNLREGYYLEITNEIKDIRNNFSRCGYCGHYQSSKVIECVHCKNYKYNVPLNSNLKKHVKGKNFINILCAYCNKLYSYNDSIYSYYDIDDKEYSKCPHCGYKNLISM